MKELTTKNLLIEIYEDEIYKNVVVDESIERTIDLTNLKRNQVAFMFYLKDDLGKEVGHLGITYQRNRFEVSFGIKNDFRNQGYMTEALMSICQWIFENTSETEIWALITNSNFASQRVLEKCSFTCVGPNEDFPNTNTWYLLRK